MELDSRVIEFTNKVEFKIGLDKEFKELYTTFKNVQANWGYVAKGAHFFGIQVPTSVMNNKNLEGLWYNSNLSVAYFTYLMQKHNKAFANNSHYFQNVKHVTLDIVQYLGLEKEFPVQLIDGHPFLTTLPFISQLQRDSRSKFYNIDLQKLFDEL